MAEIIDTDEFNTDAIAQHLRKGPFASIFEQSSEKDDHNALKFMCIVDYNAQRLDLYTRMLSADRKLLAQLMHFRSYGSFRYYDYQVGQEIGNRVLKCKFCELIGPYGCILTHMAINHNEHMPLKTCTYCNAIDLKKHFRDDSLHQCFVNYLRSNDIEVNETVFSIITEFYAMLEELSDKLAIKTLAGRGRASKNISGRLSALDEEFNRIISYLYGGNDASRLLQQSTNSSFNELNTVIISDDDDDNVDGSNNATNQNRSLPANSTASNNRAQQSNVSIKFSSNCRMNEFHEHRAHVH